MAALPATPGSKIVLATSGGSPGWLLGPLQFAGLRAASGSLAGPLFYAALWTTLILYVVVLRGLGSVSARVVLGAIAALHVVFMLAPPLLSHDVFSYIAYARLGAAHHLNPYTHSPLAITGDPGFTHAGSVRAVSAYGPIFTLLTYPLSPLGVPAALWILKVVAGLSCLGIVALVWAIAKRLGRDPLWPAVAVGLNPLVLVHVVGGAHNEALTLLVTMTGVLLWVMPRPALGTAVAALAAGIKASATIPVPFLAVASSTVPVRQRVAGAAAAVGAIAVVAVLGFGSHALDAFSLIGANQNRTSKFSIPHQLGGSAAVRAVFAAALAVLALWLLYRAWRGTIDALDAIGWTTFGVLVASAWLVPWYILWLLPFAALSRDRRLHAAALLATAWMLIISVPL